MQQGNTIIWKRRGSNNVAIRRTKATSSPGESLTKNESRLGNGNLTKKMKNKKQKGREFVFFCMENNWEDRKNVIAYTNNIMRFKQVYLILINTDEIQHALHPNRTYISLHFYFRSPSKNDKCNIIFFDLARYVHDLEDFFGENNRVTNTH